jgi:uncharacterized protein YkwD
MALKKYVKLLLIIALCTLTFTQCKKDEETKAINYIYSPEIENEIIRLVNLHRDSLGLGQLTANLIIYNECKNHSEDQARNSSMNHDGFNDRANNIFANFGGTGAAENVAFGQTTAQQVVTAWLNSKGHRANIEGDYNYTGVSVVRIDNGPNYFTHIFVKK